MRLSVGLLLLLSLCTLGAGAVWTVLNFGTPSGYGDALEYLRLAQSLQVDEYRGAVYPALIAFVHAGTDDIDWTVRILHALQIGVTLACLAYFLRVVVWPVFLPATWGARPRIACLACLSVLVLLDPLIAHFHLSVLTDALALAGSLAFCAALADLGLRRSSPVAAAFVLIASFAWTAGLRVEKSWAMVATTVAVVGVWLWLDARGEGPERRGRAALALGIVMIGFGANFGLHRAVYQDHGRWTIAETIAHHRIVYPHLEAIYDELPAEVRASLGRAQARKYDRRIHNTWIVVDRVTGKDDAARAELTRALVGPALRERWPRIVASIAAAVTENTLPPYSFHARLATWAARGADADAWEERFEATPYTWHVLSRFSPRTSVVAVTCAGLLLLVATALCAPRGWTALRSRAGPVDPSPVLALAPAVVFVVVNAVVFALIADLVHIRYVLFAHVMVLVAVYLGALRVSVAGLSADARARAGRRPGVDR